MSDFINHRDSRMIELKQETIKDENVILWEGYYRYINHDKGLLTTGFGSLEGLAKNKDIIRFDSHTLILMKSHYQEYKKPIIFICPECGAEYDNEEECNDCCPEYR